MLLRLKGHITGWSLGALLMSCLSANAKLLPERVEKAAQERIAAGDYQTLVFGVVDGERSEVVAFGKLDGGKAADGDTVYEIGSITKTFTGTLLAQAVLAGRTALDTPVAQLLPDVRIPSRGGKNITLGWLATQHSGLPRLPANFSPADPANPYADYDAAKLKAFLAEYELPRDPGATYEYSNLGFGLLGYALAQSEHTTYAALVDEGILKPLGMTMSGIPFTDTMRAHLAPGHDNSGKPVKNWDLGDAMAAAGALRSTANDMLRYLKASMGVDPSPLAAAMTLAQQPRSDVGKAGRIGLAWMITNKGIVWHGGGTGGYRSYLGFSADRRRGIVILSNTAAEIDDLALATLDADARLRPATAMVLPEASLDDYVGTYKLADEFLLKVFRMPDGLYTRATGQSAIPIFPSAPNEFFAKVAGISITFTRDAAGAVNGLVLHQNGDHEAPRLSAAELPPEPKEIARDAATLGDYVGKYKFDFGAVLDVGLQNEHLEAQLTGQGAFPIFASGRDDFFYKVVDAQLHFERDAGRVVAVVLHQNGRDLRAPRISAQ